MKYYENLAEMYVGDDVSPDFYGWVFPKYDHVAVGTGTVVNKTAIKQYQQATRDRAKVKTEGGKIIRWVGGRGGGGGLAGRAPGRAGVGGQYRLV
jgi:geranylgeranyl reductase